MLVTINPVLLDPGRSPPGGPWGSFAPAVKKMFHFQAYSAYLASIIALHIWGTARWKYINRRCCHSSILIGTIFRRPPGLFHTSEFMWNCLHSKCHYSIKRGMCVVPSYNPYLHPHYTRRQSCRPRFLIQGSWKWPKIWLYPLTTGQSVLRPKFDEESI